MTDLLEQAINYLPYAVAGAMVVSTAVYLIGKNPFKKSELEEKVVDAEIVPNMIPESDLIPVIPAVITRSTHPHPKLMRGRRLDFPALIQMALDDRYAVSLRNQESVGDIVVEMKPKLDGDMVVGMKHNIEPYPHYTEMIPEVVESEHPILTKGKKLDYYDGSLLKALREGFSILFRQQETESNLSS